MKFSRRISLALRLNLLFILFIAVLFFCPSCCEEKLATPPNTNSLKKEENKFPKQNTEHNFKKEYHFSPYKVYLEKPSHSIYDTLQLIVMKDTIPVLNERFFTGGIEDVVMRDLDQDQKPELYIVWYGTGSAGYGSVEALEIGGEAIDASELGWVQNVFFTESQVIREIYFEGDDGCCEQIGMKFIYYELVNNQFKKVHEEEYYHSDKNAIN